MAAPAIPQNYNLQTANAQNFLSWDIALSAVTYTVQRSTNGVSFANVSTAASPNYLDTAVTIGTQYWYQVKATNADGDSSYTEPQSCVPTTSGEASLGQLRLNAQQRADRVNSDFVTLTEWNSYLNQSLFELYDLLIDQYGEEYFVAASPARFYTNGGSVSYPLPNGVLTFLDQNNQPWTPPPFYKLIGVDLGLQNSNNGFVTVNKFNFIDRNKYFYPNTASTIYGVFNVQYRLVGNTIQLIPAPSANQPIQMWFIPRMTMLLKDTDITEAGISGWWEYVIVDAAIKALQKEESDVSALMMQKQALKLRIEASSLNRDAGQPDTISDTRSTSWGGNDMGPGGGFKAGF